MCRQRRQRESGTQGLDASRVHAEERTGRAAQGTSQQKVYQNHASEPFCTPIHALSALVRAHPSHSHKRGQSLSYSLSRVVTPSRVRARLSRFESTPSNGRGGADASAIQRFHPSRALFRSSVRAPTPLRPLSANVSSALHQRLSAQAAQLATANPRRSTSTCIQLRIRFLLRLSPFVRHFSSSFFSHSFSSSFVFLRAACFFDPHRMHVLC